jgi:(2Fe-2S) ferredoxin
MADDVRFDVWVCRGRVCSANGSERVAHAFEAAVVATPGARLLSGGCYGLCELGPNVVVRRLVDGDAEVDNPMAADRLSLSGADNEVVYCGVAASDAAAVIAAHVIEDTPLVRLTRAVRQGEIEPRTPIERRMRDLRVARERRGQNRG